MWGRSDRPEMDEVKSISYSYDILLCLQPPCKIYYPLDPLYDADCPEVTAYVCGTNGLTYKNECFLCVDQW